MAKVNVFFSSLKRKRETDQRNNFIAALPSLQNCLFQEPEPIKLPPSKKRRKSSRIEAAGPRKKYIEPEIDEVVEYEFQLEKVTNFNDFLQSNLLNRYNINRITDASELERLFALFVVGIHIDFKDDHHEWYEAIVEKVKISQAKHKQSTHNLHTLRIFDRFNIKILVHLKHFSSFWDQWICLPSNRIAVLRTYSHAYDAEDNIKPLAEILRELDSEQIVSIDFIADALQLDRHKLIKFVKNDSVDFDATNVMKHIIKWTKHFLISNDKINISHYRICKEYFVKPGTEETKTKDIVFEAILPSTISTKLEIISAYELTMIQDVVIDKLRNKQSDFKTMCEECLIPLGLFQEIAFGITVLLPRFIIDRVVRWSKGIHTEDVDLAVKEERLFFVKVV